MISVNRILYNKYSSMDFNLKTCLSFDGDSGETDSFLGREAVSSESYRGDFKRVHSYKYQDVLAPTITFIRVDLPALALPTTATAPLFNLTSYLTAPILESTLSSTSRIKALSFSSS